MKNVKDAKHYFVIREVVVSRKEYIGMKADRYDDEYEEGGRC